MHLAVAFLDRYVASDGRMVRYDQGGDSVSEGQAYGLLLAVATHDAARFASIWTWTKDNLQEPSGLFAYHWSNGAVVGTGAATDADLDTAWALVLAATTFDRSHLREGRSGRGLGRPGQRDRGQRRTHRAGGRALGPQRPVLGGPQLLLARGHGGAGHGLGRSALDPTGREQRAAGVRPAGRGLHPLPPSRLGAAGGVGRHLRVEPAFGGGPPSYGLDAERVPVWYAADCTASGRALSADDWSTIRGLAASGSYLAYSLTGAVQSTYSNNLGLVAAAASADAAGQRSQGRALLAQAQSGSNGQTYYGNAWVALGTVLLTTKLLSPCPPAPAS